MQDKRRFLWFRLLVCSLVFFLFSQGEVKASSFVNAKGRTLQKRFRTPEGYRRVKAKKGSLAHFLRTYRMKPDESAVLLYDERKKGNQNAHAAVFSLPIENEDLQQCADTIMRVFGEYHYKRREYEKIKFTLGGGFIADFSKWSKGYGIRVNGNRILWVSAPKNDRSYASFKRFMRMVFAYSGTLNMEAESRKIALSKAKIGDIFIKGGSPGHVVMIVDMAKNKKGKKAYLLGQSYMPAQEFHVIKNPLHKEDPWYYQEEISYPLETPEYFFPKGSLRRYR